MGRIGRILAVLAFAWLVLLAPMAVAAPPRATDEVVRTDEIVRAQEQPPPGPDLRQRDSGQSMDPQRLAIGTTGAVLILLVLASRRLRKKPVLFFRWKKK